MIWLYRLLFLPILVVVLPYYLLRMIHRGGYLKDFRHRFGRIGPLEPTPDGKVRVWIQAVSVGELLAIEPLMESFSNDEKVEIVLTTTTSTGWAVARTRKTARGCAGHLLIAAVCWLGNDSAHSVPSSSEGKR